MCVHVYICVYYVCSPCIYRYMYILCIYIQMFHFDCFCFPMSVVKLSNGKKVGLCRAGNCACLWYLMRTSIVSFKVSA